MFRFVFLSFLFFSSFTLGAFRATDILQIGPSTFYDSAANNYRIPFETVRIWETDASGNWTAATAAPGAGATINADFSSAACWRSATVRMSAVVFSATITPTYGTVTITTTRNCRTTLRVEAGKTLMCDTLIIGPNVALIVEGTIQCNNQFILQAGGFMAGKGTVRSATAQIIGDVMPGFGYRASGYYAVVGCNNCIASVLGIGTKDYPVTGGPDTSYGQTLTVNTTGLATVTGTIWILMDPANLNNTNKMQFTTVQFTSPATVRLMQPAGNYTGRVTPILANNLLQPSSLRTNFSQYNNPNDDITDWTPLARYCADNWSQLSCVPVTSSCLAPSPCIYPSNTQGCTSSSPSGTISVLLSTTPPTCPAGLDAIGTSFLVTTASGTTLPGGSGGGGGAGGSSNTTAASDGGIPRSTVIVLATVIPISVVAIAAAAGLLIFFRRRELAMKRANFNAKIAAAAAKPSPSYGV